MLPGFFRPSRPLALLSAAATALTLAAVAGALAGLSGVLVGPLGHVAGGAGRDPAAAAALLSGAGALVALGLGLPWAAWQRRRPAQARSAALLLAGLGCWLTPLACLLGSPGARWWESADWALVDSVFLVPAAAGTLALFGVPFAWARRQARRGPLGAESADETVGLVCAFLPAAVVVKALLLVQLERRDALAAGWLTTRAVLRVGPASVPLSFALLLAPALLATVAGLATATVAARRRQRREGLIAAAEAGAQPRFRVEHTPAGRALVRVRPGGREGYRHTDIDEALLLLDEPPAEPGEAALAAVPAGEPSPGASSRA